MSCLDDWEGCDDDAYRARLPFIYDVRNGVDPAARRAMAPPGTTLGEALTSLPRDGAAREILGTIVAIVV